MRTTVLTCDRCDRDAEELWSIYFTDTRGNNALSTGVKELCQTCVDEFKAEFLRPFKLGDVS